MVKGKQFQNLAYNFILFTNGNCSQLPFVNNNRAILIHIPVRSAVIWRFPNRGI